MTKHIIAHRRIIKCGHPPLNIKHPPRHRFRIRYFALAGLVVLASSFRPTHTLAVTTIADCVDVEFIFARGSGEELSSGTYRAWDSSLISELNQEFVAQPLTYHFYELGSKPQQGAQYPAVRVSGDLEGIINLGGAAISGGDAYVFGESVSAGVAELKAYMGRIASVCPQTKFVLGGYSQGAMVLTRSLPNLDPNSIIYVATFGDPKLYLPEGAHVQQDDFYVPEACYGRNLSEYREYVPDCYAYAGILGAVIPYQPIGYSGKLGTWCNQDDIMCSSGSSIQDHTSYVSEQLYGDAARRIVRAIKSAFIDRSDHEYEPNQHVHEVAIVADITGSMARGDLYWRLTKEAKNLAQRVVDSGGRVSYFVYRDLIEGVETKRLCDFTCTLEELDDAVQSVRLIDGEDDNESALSAMNYAINHAGWTTNSEKSLLILTDAGLHEPDRDGTTSADVVASSRMHGGVKIFAPVWKKFVEEYQTVAEQTGGQVLRLEDGIELATSAILPNPIINLAQEHYIGPIGSRFVFDASASQVFAGPDLTYDWDLDGNGLYELENAGPVVEQTFNRFEGNVFVRVTDRAGHSAVASIYVKTQELLTAPAAVEISAVDFEMSSNTRSPSTVSGTLSTDANRILLVVDEAILGFIEVANGQSRFAIEGLRANSYLTFIPYSVAGVRGIGRTIKLGNDIDDSPTPNPTNPPAASQPEREPNSPTSPHPSSMGNEALTFLTTIPKAPNTGLRRSNSEEVDMLQP